MRRRRRPHEKQWTSERGAVGCLTGPMHLLISHDWQAANQVLQLLAG